MSEQCFLGLMSGTSMDGVDAAIVSFSKQSYDVIATHFTAYPKPLKLIANDIVQPESRTHLSALSKLDHEVGKIFAKAAVETIQKAPHSEVIAIGSHGQTIFHDPTSEYPNSWQLGNPSLIAEATGITTISDWRRRDMATGGQGAPLTPLFNAQFFRGNHDLSILNLGGIANITVIPANKQLPVIGYDTGPANTLIDLWIKQNLDKNLDHDGLWAASGTVNQALLRSMLTDSYFQQPPPKSTGRELFNAHFIAQHIDGIGGKINSEDVQTTLTELTAISIVNAIQKNHPQTAEVLLSGGGAHNHYLVERLKFHGGNIEWKSAHKSGIDPDSLEAVAFAWFAKQTLEGKPLFLETITGGKHARIAGAIYPGHHWNYSINT